VRLALWPGGSALAALALGVERPGAAPLMIGSSMARWSPHSSFVLEGLAPPQRRAEVLALLRTANALGVIFASAVLTVASISVTLIVVSGLMIAATLAVAMTSARRQSPAPAPRASVKP